MNGQQQSIGRFSKTDAEKFTRGFLEADIPIHKANHPALRKLFDIIGHPLPSSSAMREHVKSITEKEFDVGQQVAVLVDEAEIKWQKFLHIMACDVAHPEKYFLLQKKPLTLPPTAQSTR